MAKQKTSDRMGVKKRPTRIYYETLYLPEEFETVLKDPKIPESQARSIRSLKCTNPKRPNTVMEVLKNRLDSNILENIDTSSHQTLPDDIDRGYLTATKLLFENAELIYVSRLLGNPSQNKDKYLLIFTLDETYFCIEGNILKQDSLSMHDSNDGLGFITSTYFIYTDVDNEIQKVEKPKLFCSRNK